MSDHTSPSNVEAWGEAVSAYLDGELPQEEAARVEELLQRDPKARRWADDARRLSAACQAAPASRPSGDLAPAVLAEALRRQATGATPATDDRATTVDRAEPDGEIGLPFDRVSGAWRWLGLAVAATLLFSFFGRPGATPQRGAELERGLAALQQAAPEVRVRDVAVTPAMLGQLQRRLALQSARQAQLPSELMNVSRRGVVVQPAEPALPPAEELGEELFYVDASEEEVDRLLSELDSVHVTEPSRPTEPTAAPTATATKPPGVRAVRIRLKLRPDASGAAGAAPLQASGAAPQRKLVLLRIKVRRPQ